MKTQWPHLVFTIATMVFGLFGKPIQACAQDVINITKATGGKLQINAKGTFTVGTGRKLLKINLVCKSGNTSRIMAAISGTDWNVTMGILPAGTYDVSAEIVTTNMCGEDETTTPTPPAQTIKGVVVTAGCTATDLNEALPDLNESFASFLSFSWH
jgi:hypothetical protein